VPVTAADFETAAHFADRHDLGLRGGDALHMAVALLNGCALATLDRTMATAATACGVPVSAVVA
jgi:predicted nucleic acid-binding protein